jgi:hypothetical protein
LGEGKKKMSISLYNLKSVLIILKNHANSIGKVSIARLKNFKGKEKERLKNETETITGSYFGTAG